LALLFRPHSSKPGSAICKIKIPGFAEGVICSAEKEGLLASLVIPWGEASKLSDQTFLVFFVFIKPLPAARFLRAFQKQKIPLSRDLIR
jgi:hypothetical protein